ncbi:hypothetical protein QN363_21055, partial [Undibacterium sp. CCC2.1]
LEYRISYTNQGSSPIKSLSIADSTPSYTSFVSALAGTTPASLSNCRKQTPANPAPAALLDCAATQTV